MHIINNNLSGASRTERIDKIESKRLQRVEYFSANSEFIFTYRNVKDTF